MNNLVYKKVEEYQMEYQFEFLRYLNLAREHPAFYASILERQLSEFTEDGSQLLLEENIYYQTNQGKTAWVQARDFLLAQKPLSPLLQHEGLTKAARQHQNDLCKNGIFGHIGTDNSTFNERILRFCKKGPGAMAEMIGTDFQFSKRNTPELTVLGLIIDDGIKNRGHRNTIFNQNYRYVGWASGKQSQKIITVFNLSENNLKLSIQQTSKSATSLSSITTLSNRSINSSINSSIRPENIEVQLVEVKIKENCTPFSDLSNNEAAKKSRGSKISEINSSKGALENNQSRISNFSKKQDSFINNDSLRKGKINQKRQNSIIYYKDGCKIMKSTIKYYYDDGKIEQRTQKRTLFDQKQISGTI